MNLNIERLPRIKGKYSVKIVGMIIFLLIVLIILSFILVVYFPKQTATVLSAV